MWTQLANSRQPTATLAPDNRAKPKAAAKCPTCVPMDYLLPCLFRLVRSTDRLAGGRSVLRHTIDRMRLWCVFLNTRGVSRITSPCCLVGLLLHSHESKGKCDAHVEGLDGLGRTFKGMLIILGVGGCGLDFMDGARSVEAGVWVYWLKESLLGRCREFDKAILLD